MRVTRPMIERGAEAMMAMAPDQDPYDEVETVLRAALNDPKEPERPMEGQTSIDVVEGRTVVVGG